jgi:hypothetical protein
MREAHAQAIGRLARFAVANIVGKDNVEPGYIEGLPRPEENVGEDGVEQRMGVSSRAVKQQHGVVSMAGRIAVRLAQREVVQV